MRVLAALLLTAGCFDGRVPAGVQVYCSVDADCPDALSCDVDSHLCTADLVPPEIVSAVLVDPPLA